jgi:hypothetical protein
LQWYVTSYKNFSNKSKINKAKWFLSNLKKIISLDKIHWKLSKFYKIVNFQIIRTEFCVNFVLTLLLLFINIPFLKLCAVRFATRSTFIALSGRAANRIFGKRNIYILRPLYSHLIRALNKLCQSNTQQPPHRLTYKHSTRCSVCRNIK